MKEYQEKTLGELKDQKKLLIKEIKMIREKKAQVEEVNTEFMREFELLNEIIEKGKKAVELL